MIRGPPTTVSQNPLGNTEKWTGVLEADDPTNPREHGLSCDLVPKQTRTAPAARSASVQEHSWKKVWWDPGWRSEWDCRTHRGTRIWASFGERCLFTRTSPSATQGWRHQLPTSVADIKKNLYENDWRSESFHMTRYRILSADCLHQLTQNRIDQPTLNGTDLVQPGPTRSHRSSRPNHINHLRHSPSVGPQLQGFLSFRSGRPPRNSAGLRGGQTRSMHLPRSSRDAHWAKNLSQKSFDSLTCLCQQGGA